ncbi:spore coat protein [uncultured Clostridium sp.]|uniref:spore coat protein n=1 Tax=uncultured Clostridium sp. TaxID=59620 RepID=UPI0028E4770E|nr:spore coat protein [uncultured Clostridium sp.]
MPTPESLNLFINDTIACDRPFTIGATCVAEIARNVFVLLVQIELNARGRELEEVVVIRISPALAAELIPLIGRCRILCPNEIPTPAPGREVNLICSFVFDGNVFLVFEVETNRREELVLVRVPLCTIS